MSDFSLWFTEGLWHIADLKAYDHILFLVVLFCGIDLKHWKNLLLLITAFTLGHSITLALSVLSVVKIKVSLVELLIPCTILATAVYNMLTLKTDKSKRVGLHFLMALLFGLIHGLGFSVLLKSLLGRTNSIFTPLLSFNLGLELGQIIIIGVIILVSLVFTKLLKVPSHQWRFFLSAAAFGVAFMMALERI